MKHDSSDRCRASRSVKQSISSLCRILFNNDAWWPLVISNKHAKFVIDIVIFLSNA